jgi:hypothetical protein
MHEFVYSTGCSHKQKDPGEGLMLCYGLYAIYVSIFTFTRIRGGKNVDNASFFYLVEEVVPKILEFWCTFKKDLKHNIYEETVNVPEILNNQTTAE